MLRQRALKLLMCWGPVLLIVTVCGCGGSKEYTVAQVQGRVLCNGEPVPGGFVHFNPINAPDKTGRAEGFAGKAGVGVVQPDGTFVVTTYKDKDGALIGPHKISFEFPVIPDTDLEWQEMEPADAERLRRLEALPCRERVDVEEFTVEAGRNELTINLVGD